MEEHHLRVQLPEEDKRRAEEYAEKHGLQKRRAYGELIQAGLDSEE